MTQESTRWGTGKQKLLPSFAFNLDFDGKKDKTTKCNDTPEDEDSIQQCKLSYKYMTMGLTQMPQGNDNKYWMAKFSVSTKDQGTRVTFNRLTYTPDTVYLINPGGFNNIQNISGDQLYHIVNETFKKYREDENAQELIISHSLAHSEGGDRLWLIIPINIIVPKETSPEEDKVTESAGGRPFGGRITTYGRPVGE